MNDKEKLAHWMMKRGYATGHGDTMEDLLRELAWQLDERIEKAVAKERERCAKVAEGWPCEAGDDKYQSCGNGTFWDAGTNYDQGRIDASTAIRARGSHD